MHIKTFENFLGQTNQNNKKQRKLSHAKELEKRGDSAETIRLLTGWFRNPNDNEWRFENSSYALQLRPILYNNGLYKFTPAMKVQISLKNMIRNTSLFKDYPELKDVTVILDSFGYDGNGSYNYATKEITIDGVELLNHGRLKNLADIIPIYQKEITDEYINTLPTTDRSGNPFSREERKKVYIQRLEKTIQEFEEKSKQPVFNLTDKHKGIIVHEIQHAIQFIEDLPLGDSPRNYNDKMVKDEETGNYQKVTAHQQYLNSAGEIEAREAQDRINLNSSDKYIVFDSRYGETDGFIKQFDTNEEAELFIRAKIIIKPSGERIASKFVEIEKKAGYKNNQPLKTNQNVNSKDVNIKYYRDRINQK